MMNGDTAVPKPPPRRPRAVDARPNVDAKNAQLCSNTNDAAAGSMLTTNHGVLINDDQNTLKAGDRGPSAGRCRS
jgi:catalase